MQFAKITSKGQLTIPIQIRKKLGVEAGDFILFTEKDGKLIISRAILPTSEQRLPGEAEEESASTTISDAERIDRANCAALRRRFGRELPLQLLDALRERDRSAEELGLMLKLEHDELFELLAEAEDAELLSFIQGAYQRLC